MTEHDLLGYILGLLDADEHSRVEQRVRVDETVRVQVETLRLRVAPMSCDAEHCEPPQDLAIRVCQTLRQVHIEIREHPKSEDA